MENNRTLEKRLTDEESEILKRMYLKGIKIELIAHTLEISVSGVKQRIRKGKFANRVIDFSTCDIDIIVEGWRDKLSYSQIANRLGGEIQKHHVQYQLTKLDLVG